MITDVKKAAELLKSNDDFLILSHANPDGDTLGCAYGLCGMLQKMGKRAKVMCADEIAPRMEFLRDTVIQQSFEEKTIVSVDVADRKLLGDLDAVYGGRIFLAIDHHESRQEFAKYTLVDPEAAAACELIFQIAEEMNAQLDGEIASCLYTGLATDTGCFKYSNTTSRTHIIAAKLMAYEFDVSGINYKLFDMKSKGRLELEQAITQGMEFFCDDRVAVVWLTTELMDRFMGRVDSEDFNKPSPSGRGRNYRRYSKAEGSCYVQDLCQNGRAYKRRKRVRPVRRRRSRQSRRLYHRGQYRVCESKAAACI